MSSSTQSARPASTTGSTPESAPGATPTTGPARRSLFGRRAADDTGPRASLSQLLPYLLEHRRVMVLVLILSIFGSLSSLAQPLLVSNVISVVQDGQPLGGLVWLLVAFVVLAGILAGYQHYLLQRTGEGVVLSSRRQLVAKMLHLPIAEFDTRRVGDLVSRVGSDTTLLRAVLTQGVVESVGGALTFVGALIAMAILDPVLLLLTLLVVAIAVVTVVTMSARIRPAIREGQKKVGDLAAAVERSISAIRTVRAANATDREVDAINRDAEGAWLQGIKVARISALITPVAIVAMQVSFLVVLGVGGYRVASGATSVANLVAFILFLFLMIMPLGQFFGAINAVNQALGALGRIQEVLALPDESDADRGIAPLADAATVADARSSAPAIEFVDIRFGYDTLAEQGDSRPAVPAADSAAIVRQPVLHGVSFTVPRGSRTALVGPSGAGKSTILSLIERFYDADSGSIRLGGVDIRGIDRVALRSQIGYVEQDAPVLAGSLRDNLLLASPEATDADCIDVLHRVNLAEVLERDPAGLDAQVGEDGIMLSGGERQRLAIARTLLSAPPILLLDESTSSLDGLNEQMLREAIDAVATGRTLIVIAHRLSTVVDSDSIVVLDHGRVVGVGTHSELVTTVPLYRELAKHQLLV
ncbi:ABC transporter ATP-binding protein [Naasia lichenicola]|uniref:ABC transporter ATP-binding protein n=1 Tax=Naasia lichenicola TaxID=2565933 RepID=A0A4S4FKD0_9MICO|nr:ABC transporter ATP-binding protein [Naasia lichenicola]THG30883.1 ABC transporter ATP-binding protein [Naasia lichenicola]